MAFAGGKLIYCQNMPLAPFVRANERVSTRTVLTTLDSAEFQVPCHAGALSAVISEEGDVYACEMLDSMAKLWADERARSMRTFIRRDTKCFCTTSATCRSICSSTPRSIHGS